MSSLIVAKFGGTSMAAPHAMRMAAQRVRSNPDMRVVVVSAPGVITERNNPDCQMPACGNVKVTKALIDSNGNDIASRLRSQRPIEEGLLGIAGRYEFIESGLGIPEPGRVSSTLARRIKENVAAFGPTDASIASLGEELQARLFAAYLNTLGVRSRYLDPRDLGLVVEPGLGNAYVVNPETYPGIRESMQPLIDDGHVLVVPGFYGYDSSGVVQIFPRGGSDYTGAVLAAALRAGLYQNFTDVDGVRVVEPELCPDAPLVRSMTHRELSELTLGGRFGVFQYEATIPLRLAGITTQVLNTFDESALGTYILPQTGNGGPIAGIAYRGECTLFEIVTAGGANTLGLFEKVGHLFASLGVSVEHMPSSTNDISVIVRRSSINDARLAIKDIVSEIRDRLQPFDIRVQDNIGLIAVVGENISRTVGLGARIFGAVARAGANIVSFQHQGITTTMMFRNGDARTAATAVYEEFFRNGHQ